MLYYIHLFICLLFIYTLQHGFEDNDNSALLINNNNILLEKDNYNKITFLRILSFLQQQLSFLDEVLATKYIHHLNWKL